MLCRTAGSLNYNIYWNSSCACEFNISYFLCTMRVSWQLWLRFIHLEAVTVLNFLRVGKELVWAFFLYLLLHLYFIVFFSLYFVLSITSFKQPMHTCTRSHTQQKRGSRLPPMIWSALIPNTEEETIDLQYDASHIQTTRHKTKWENRSKHVKT